MKNRIITVTLGQDTPAYANLTLSFPGTATDDDIIEHVQRVASDRAADMVFDPSFDWSGLRATEIVDETGRCLASDIAIERSGEDLGLVAEAALKGLVPITALIEEARRQGIRVDPRVADRLLLSTGNAEHETAERVMPTPG